MSNFENIQDYEVTMMKKWDIKPSPENDEIYGECQRDDAMETLIESIREHGLEQPIYVSADNYIISGHRRHFACHMLDYPRIPVRVAKDVWREGNPQWYKILTDFNPQRVKDAAALFKEALLKVKCSDDEYRQVMRQRECKAKKKAEFMTVHGVKEVKPITDRRREFFEAAKEMINKHRAFWPLSVRQCHYYLLDWAPMKQTVKTPSEANRYVNDLASYKAISRLLTSGRYQGLIPFDSIDDESRPTIEWGGWDCAQEFITEQTSEFLNGFQLDLQRTQPDHIELLAEKKTLKQIVRPVCAKFHIPCTLGSGYGNPSIWKKMVERFRESGKERMILVVVSDYDPEGYDLADDAIRALRQQFNVNVEYKRSGINRDQIEELDLSQDFNPVKVDSTRFPDFVERTGGTKTWECEALPPKYLQESIDDAFRSVMDMDIYNAATDQERAAAGEIFSVKQELAQVFGM